MDKCLNRCPKIPKASWYTFIHDINIFISYKCLFWLLDCGISTRCASPPWFYLMGYSSIPIKMSPDRRKQVLVVVTYLKNLASGEMSERVYTCTLFLPMCYVAHPDQQCSAVLWMLEIEISKSWNQGCLFHLNAMWQEHSTWKPSPYCSTSPSFYSIQSHHDAHR